MKLRQNQVWQKGAEYIRIVHRDNLSVVYKIITDVSVQFAPHQRTTKKEFCRMLHGAVLLDKMPVPVVEEKDQAAQDSTDADAFESEMSGTSDSGRE